ncbi:hypothetical protein JCM10212_005360 [Sporobolomyces blumeae]
MVQSGAAPVGASSTATNGNSMHSSETNGHGHLTGSEAIANGNGATARDGVLDSTRLDSTMYDGEDGFVPLWEGSNVDRRELVRIALQAFEDMGYRSTAAALQAESGFVPEDPGVAQFRSSVLEGRWDEVEALLHRLPLERPEDAPAVHFAISQQKFLESMEVKNTKKALTILRNELSPLGFNSDRLHFLSSLVMCSTPDELYVRAGWDGANGTSRRRLLVQLQGYFSPTVMLPERRLATLLSQAQSHQERHHAVPSSSTEPFSLLFDADPHSTELFPDHCSRTLRDHTDEVWRLAWSHDGKFLATAGKDRSAIVWSVEDDFKPVHFYREHSDPISCLAWSPDDSVLLTAAETVIKMWSLDQGRCIATLARHDYPIGALAWLTDGQGFVSGGMDLKVYFWNLKGEIDASLPSSPTRVIDLAVTPDGSKLVCVGRADTTEPHMVPSRMSSRSTTPAMHQHTLTPPLGARHEKRISVYDLAKMELLYEIVQPSELTSVEISGDSKYAIVNHAPKEILYVELDTGSILRKFEGHDQGQYVLRSCFGGALENFVLSGTADGNIVVYHRDTGRLVHTLTGHGATTVNAVAWNPTHRAMWASCSDDRTVRIWEMSPDKERELSSKRKNALRPIARS